MTLRNPLRLAAPVLAILAILCTSTACLRSPHEREAAFLRKGKQYLKKRDYARALLQFKNAMLAQPKDAEPAYQLGVTYLDMRDMRDAAAYFKKATELNPKDTDAQLKLAILLANFGNKQLLTDARTRLKQLVKSQPGNTEAADALALAEFKLGQRKEAEKNLERVLSHSSAQLKSSAELARMDEATKDLAGAETVLKNAAARSPGSIEAFLLLGQFYLRNGRLPEAEEEARRALRIDGKNPAALALLGVVQDRRGARDEAESTLKQVSMLGGKRLKPLYGILLLEHGKMDAAIAEFKRLASEYPSDRAARTRLVNAYLATNRPEAAERVLTEAIQKNSKDTEALLQLSSLYLARGKLNAAEANLQELLYIRPIWAPAHYQLAHVYERQGRKLLYRHELGEAVRLDPKLLAARLELAQALTWSQDAQSALATLNDAPAGQKSALAWRLARNQALFADRDYAALGRDLEQMPANGNPAILMQDASLHYAQKDYTGARAVLEQVVHERPGDLHAIDALAQTWAAQGEQRKALQTVRDFAGRSGASPAARQLLAVWLVRDDDRAGASLVLTSLLTKDPGFQPATLLLSKLDFEDKKYDAAGRLARGLLAAHPSNIEARLRLADSEYMSGKQSAAIEQYRTVLKYDGWNWMALNNLAYLLVNTNTDEAMKYTQALLGLQPDNPIALDTAGWVLLHKNRYVEAIADLKRAVRGRNTATSKYHLALAYMKAGQREEGQEMLREALAQDPHLADTQRQDWALWRELAK